MGDVDVLKQMIAIDKEARRIERERCVALVRQAVKAATRPEEVERLWSLVNAMEAPDAP